MSIFLLYYLVLWPTNAQLFHKFSHCYMFRHYHVILRRLVISTLPSYTSMSVIQFTFKIFHIGFLLLKSQWLKSVKYSWHDSVETCSSVIICEIIVHLLVTVQNNKRCMAHSVKIIEAQQTKIHNNYKNTRLKFLKTNAAIWFNKNCCKFYYQQLHLTYWCNLARY
jgi:hypothetical protein